MGVIQRQGFKSSIVSYIGVAIGAASTLLVYPRALEVLGLFRSMFDAAVLISIVVMLGSAVAGVRFFPRYRDPATGHHGLLTWLLMVTGAGFLLFLFSFPFVYEILSHKIFHDENEGYRKFIIYLIPLTLFVALLAVLTRYSSNFRRITIPAALEQLSIKITLPIIFLLFIFGYINVTGVVIGFVASYALAVLGMIIYLKSIGEWKLTRPAIMKDPVVRKEYINYSWYGLLTGVGSQIAFKIDSLMVAGMIKFEAAGIYAIALTLSEIIIKPMRSLSSIAGPILAHHIEHGHLEEVRTLYRKSALNMTIIGVGMFLLIWTVVPFIFAIMPNSEVMREGSYVVFFLGLAQVWDMMTGINTEIISYSKYYRFNLYLTLFLATTNIIANLFLINLYGVMGAALATCLSMFLFNVAKLVFIKIKFGFFPFSIHVMPVIAFGLGSWLIAKWIPLVGQVWVDMIFKGFVFAALYGFAIWKLNLSPDINQWLLRTWHKVKATIFTKSNPG